MNSLKAKHKILYGLMTIVFLSAWYCRDIFTSSYVKLQDAFAAETGAVGSHAKIGYVIPASSNFTYSDPNAFTADNTTNLGVLTEAVVHWQADNSA